MRMMTQLVARVPCAQAVEVLEEVGGIELAKSSSWHIGQDCGARIGAEMAAEEMQHKRAPQPRRGADSGGAPLNRAAEQRYGARLHSSARCRSRCAGSALDSHRVAPICGKVTPPPVLGKSAGSSLYHVICY
jgi:hypothetical protein